MLEALHAGTTPDRAGGAGPDQAHWAAPAARLRRSTYRALSDLRTEFQRTISEPPSISRRAAAWWPAVVGLEQVMDAVTSTAVAVRRGRSAAAVGVGSPLTCRGVADGERDRRDGDTAGGRAGVARRRDAQAGHRGGAGAAGRARRRAPDHTRLTWMSHCLGAVAGDRGDLFAEVAGLALGTAEGRTPSTRPGQVVVDMCRAADADETLIPQWVAEGKRRAEAARMKPHGGEQRLAPRRP